MLDILMISGQILSGAFLAYGGLLSLAELVSAKGYEFAGSCAGRVAVAAKFKVGFGREY